MDDTRLVQTDLTVRRRRRPLVSLAGSSRFLHWPVRITKLNQRPAYTFFFFRRWSDDV